MKLSTSNKLSSLTLVEALTRLAAVKDKGIFLINGSNDEKLLSYSELLLNAKLALGLLQNQYGLKKGDEVVIQDNNNELFITGFWACILGGLIPVPVAVGRKKEHRQKLFNVWRQLNNPFFLSNETNLEKIVKEGEVLKEAAIAEHIAERFIDINLLGTDAGAPTLYEPRPTELAYLQFSSGSTGRPKGVMLTHENLIYNNLDIANRLDITPDNKPLSWVPLTHDFGMIAVHLTSIYRGCSQCILPTALFVRRPLLWMEMADKYQATHLFSPNFGYEYFLKAYEGRTGFEWDLSNVKRIVNGAEPIIADICNKFTGALTPYGLNPNTMSPSYGLAEASVGVTSTYLENPLQELFIDRFAVNLFEEVEIDYRRTSPDQLSFVNVGPIFEHCELRICNDQDEVLPANRIGHIQIKGKNVCIGYYNNPEATERLFTADNWVKTGDLGLFMDNGDLVITGRQKNMIIIQGQNLYPQDIEQSLFDLPGIALSKVAACGLPGNGTNKEQLLIFVLFKKPIEQFLDLISAINERISDVFGIIPDQVIPVLEIPKTTSGKVQHFEFIKRFQQGAYDGKIAAITNINKDRLLRKWTPMAPDEQREAMMNWLSELVGDLLQTNANEVDIYLPLRDQGMNSFQAIQMRNIIQQQLDLDIPVGTIYKYPTVDRLTDFLLQCLFGAPTDEEVVNSGSTSQKNLMHQIMQMSDEEILKMLEEHS